MNRILNNRVSLQVTHHRELEPEADVADEGTPSISMGIQKLMNSKPKLLSKPVFAKSRDERPEEFSKTHAGNSDKRHDSEPEESTSGSNHSSKVDLNDLRKTPVWKSGSQGPVEQTDRGKPHRRDPSTTYLAQEPSESNIRHQTETHPGQQSKIHLHPVVFRRDR